MTEDEAKTKWCPFAVASHTDPRQRVEDRFLHQCIGSACMAWRTANIIVHEGDDYPIFRTEVFCGLAGRLA